MLVDNEAEYDLHKTLHFIFNKYYNYNFYIETL